MGRKLSARLIFTSLFALFFLVLLPAKPPLATLVTGSWTLTLDNINLISPAAGSDITGTYESTTTQVYVEANRAELPWRLYIRRVDVSWPAGVTIELRRTGDGTPGGKLTGTPINQYVPVTTTDTLFVTNIDGSDVKDIPIQFRVSGLTIPNLRVKTYTTTIYYTVTEY